MFTFNEQNNKSTSKSNFSSQQRVAFVTEKNLRQLETAQLKSLIGKLKLRSNTAFNAKVKQQSQQLCTRLNQLQYGLKDDFQKSLGRYVKQASALGKPSGTLASGELDKNNKNKNNNNNNNKHEERSVTRKTTPRSSIRCATGSATNKLNPRQLLGANGALLLKRSQSLNQQRQPPPARTSPDERASAAAATGGGRNLTTAAIRRHEWARRSLQQARAAVQQRALGSGDCTAAAEKLAASLIDKSPTKPDTAERANVPQQLQQQQRQEQREQERRGSRLIKWPSLSGKGATAKTSAQVQQQPRSSKSASKKKQQQQQASEPGEKSRSPSIASLLSAAAATRRQKRPSSHTRLPSGARLVFVVALQLLLVLATLLGPAQVTSGAPIGQFVVAQRLTPVWLGDGLVDIGVLEDTSSAESQLPRVNDGAATVDDAPGPLDELAAVLAGRLDLALSLQQQEQAEQAAPERKWLFSEGRPDSAGGWIGAERQKLTGGKIGPERLGIERRRLNRDRALELPAWLRTRPTRASSDATDRESEAADDDDEDYQEAGRDADGTAGRPRRRAPLSSRGRQLRASSDEIYEQILAHLADGTLEGRSFLDSLYDELELRLKSQRLESSGALDSVGPSGKSAQFKSENQQQATGSPEMPTGAQHKQVGDESQEPGDALIVAGDEISSDDDVIPLEPSVSPREPQQGGEEDKQARVALTIARDQLTVGRPDGASDDATSGTWQTDVAILAPVGGTREQQQQTFERITQAAASTAALADLARAAAAPEHRGIIGPMQQAAALPASDQQQAEQSFHVFEDIDQADSSQEIPLAQQPPATGDDDHPTPQMSSFEKRSAELDSSLVGDFKELDSREAGARVARRASFGRDELDPARRGPGGRPQVVELVRAGYFSRAQLLQFVVKLRSLIESTLELPRGTIRSVLPVSEQQLLLELDTSRLGMLELLRLARSYGAVRDSRLIVSWPALVGGSQLENPLPILAAALDALDDDELARERMLGFGVGGAPLARDDQINEQEARREKLRAQLQGGPSAFLAAQQQQQQDSDASGVEFASERPTFSSLPVQPGGSAELARLALAQLGGAAQRASLDSSHWRRRGQAVAPEAIQADGAEWTLLSSLAPAWLTEQNQARTRAQLVPLAGLASYLSAIHGTNDNDDEDQLTATLQLGRPVQLTSGASEQLESLAAALVRAQQRLGALSQVGVLGANRSAAVGSAHPLRAVQGHLIAALGGAGAGGFGPHAASQSHDFVRALGAHLLAILLALAVTFLIVKLILKRLDTSRAAGGRRKLSTVSSSSSSYASSKARRWLPGWAGGASSRGPQRDGDIENPCKDARVECDCASIEGETLSGGNKQSALGRAATFLHRRNLSTDSGLDGNSTDAGSLKEAELPAAGPSDKIRRSFEQLARRLTRLLSLTGGQQRARADEKGDVEHATAPSCPAEKGAAGGPQQFRSSTSYVRSLIEALTKAALAQVPSGAASTSTGITPLDDDDEDDEEKADTFQVSSTSTNNKSAAAAQQQQQFFQEPEDEKEILMAQMDISAAHLILDYMEKHLVDKERLRREWLELNGAPAGKQQAAASASADAGKPSQATLLRLARAALSDENRAKNRNPSVVPFDRNRVRLGAGKPGSTGSAGGCSSSGGSSSSLDGLQAQAATTSSAPGGGQTAKQKSRSRGARGAPRQRGQPAAQRADDYINASFIHDDDPRRATHIIAQGPSEQTCGQFWQMVWEQEIAVIVMLTRLNENAKQMCHCYWPTQIVAAELSPPAAGSVNGASTSATRRSSVTSVFSGLAAGAKHPSCAGGSSSPIVAGGAMNDSALYFEVPAAESKLAATSRQTSRSSAEDELELAAPAAGQQGQAKVRGKPSGRPATIKLEVRLISEHVSSSDYLVRNMYLINRSTGETRTISQFHYLAWQEGRTPDSVRSFLQFRRKVHKSYRNLTSPILVHCSDGAGRSGTYALIDIILERVRNGAKEIDLRATLEHLRDQRVGLCETQSQFEFVLVALAEEIQIILKALAH